MTRKYVRRSKGTINLDWIDEESHTEILDLWKREPKERRPTAPAIEKGHYHAPARHQYSFGRETRRNHGNGWSYNYVSFLIDREAGALQVDVWNYQTNNRTKALLPLKGLPRDPFTFFEFAKEKVLKADDESSAFSFNRKAVEETWAALLIGVDSLPKFEPERMHEMENWNS